MTDEGDAETQQCEWCEDNEATDEGVVAVDGVPLGPPMPVCEDCKVLIE